MAEEQGFEPWEDFHPRRFSRPVHSTTLPLLRHALPKTLELILQTYFSISRNYLKHLATLGIFADRDAQCFSDALCQVRVSIRSPLGDRLLCQNRHLWCEQRQ